MNPINLLFVSVLTLLSGVDIDRTQVHPSDCGDKIDVKVVAEASTNGQANGKVKFEVKDASKNSSRDMYLICEKVTGRILNDKTTHTPAFDKLKKGDYFCIVSIGDCSKKVNFTIE